MASCSLKATVVYFSGFESGKSKGVLCLRSPTSLRLFPLKSTSSPVLNSDLMGKPLFFSDPDLSSKSPARFSLNAQAMILTTLAQRWWEKTLKPNMVEIRSAQELIDSLKGAGNKLVIVDFYSPGCGGCRALHPKICQLAEENPDAIFLKVNYEELKSMCYSLHIHVLPFFRFYRGLQGRLCSFSCTNATIKKFRDALEKYGGCGGECESVKVAKGLEESELKKLASDGQISISSEIESSSMFKELVLNTMDSSKPGSRLKEGELLKV